LAAFFAALVAVWYEDLTGNSSYQRLALAQRDYLLGSNPWGVSFVNSIGSTWPHHPHHQVAALNGSELVGFWDEGPVPLADYLAQNITLHEVDAYAAFQSEASVFHDNVQDYITNKPTISMNATGLALVPWYALP
jgi:endoglucanase